MKIRPCRQLLPARVWCLLAVLTLFVGGQLLLPSTSVGADPLVPPGARGESVPRWVATWKAAAPAGSFNDLSDLAVDATGEVYTVDQENERVQVFDADGRFLRAWGSAGTAPGQFSGATGIALDGRGHAYVSDGNNHRVQKFSP